MMTTLANLQPQTCIFILHILILHIHMHARKCNRKKIQKARKGSRRPTQAWHKKIWKKILKIALPEEMVILTKKYSEKGFFTMNTFGFQETTPSNVVLVDIGQLGRKSIQDITDQ